MVALLIAKPQLVQSDASRAAPIDVNQLKIQSERGGWRREEDDPMKRFAPNPP
jgi:hypothetical protein